MINKIKNKKLELEERIEELFNKENRTEVEDFEFNKIVGISESLQDIIEWYENTAEHKINEVSYLSPERLKEVWVGVQISLQNLPKELKELTKQIKEREEETKLKYEKARLDELKVNAEIEKIEKTELQKDLESLSPAQRKRIEQSREQFARFAKLRGLTYEQVLKMALSV